MALTNFQFDQIAQSYQARRLNARRLLDERTQEVYEKVESYKEFDEQIASLNVAIAKAKILDNDADVEKLSEKTEDLRIKKKLALTKAGFPVTYLDPVYTCPYCKDTGMIDGEKCHCFKQAMMDMLYEQSNIKHVLEEENFENIVLDYQVGEHKERFVKAYENALEFCDRFEKEYNNLFFFGESGTGKTYLTNCVVNEVISKGHLCIYFSAIELFNSITDYKFNRNSKDFVANPYDDIYDCDLLVIDDLGSECSNTLTNSELFNIINKRSLGRKSTIISTNLSLGEFQNRYSDKISSRIISQYELCMLTGNNIRINKKRIENRK